MYQVIDGRLVCDGEPVGVRRHVVRAVLATRGYGGHGDVRDLPEPIAAQMIRIEKDLLLSAIRNGLRTA